MTTDFIQVIKKNGKPSEYSKVISILVHSESQVLRDLAYREIQPYILKAGGKISEAAKLMGVSDKAVRTWTLKLPSLVDPTQLISKVCPRCNTVFQYSVRVRTGIAYIKCPECRKIKPKDPIVVD